MHDLTVFKKNESYIRLECDYGISQELSDYFSFYIPGYQFTPKFKNKMWDGKIRLYNSRTNLIYYGLISYIKLFCEERDYSVAIDPKIELQEEFSLIEAQNFIETLKLPHIVRDYQLSAFVNAIRNKRIVILSPTGSGKSLVLYLIIRYLQRTEKKGLLVVPTISLVSQMYKDFQDYGYDSEKYCHRIQAGIEKDSEKFLYISTWQSIFTQPAKYFHKFDFIMGDEAHTFKATSLTHIVESCVNAKYRIGTTGTLPNNG